MVSQARDRILLGLGLHGLALALAALDEAAFFFIQVDQLAHLHFEAFGAALAGRIVALGDTAQYGLGQLAGFVGGNGPEAPNGDEALGSPTAAAFGPVSDDECLCAAGFHPQAEAAQYAVPQAIALVAGRGRIDDRLGQLDAFDFWQVPTQAVFDHWPPAVR
jgi:hypothetical protein